MTTHYKKFCSCLAGLEIDAPDGMFDKLINRFDEHVRFCGEFDESNHADQWRYRAWRHGQTSLYFTGHNGREEADDAPEEKLNTAN